MARMLYQGYLDVPAIEGALVTDIGLQEITWLDYEAWRSAGRKLLHLERALPYALGDWLNYGETRWGDKYTQALADTDYSYSRLTTFSYVCRRIEFSRRRQELSFGHHEVVAPLEPLWQDRWLQRAIGNSWSIRALIDALANRPTRGDSDVWWLYQLRDLLERISKEAPTINRKLQAIITKTELDRLIKEMVDDS